MDKGPQCQPTCAQINKCNTKILSLCRLLSNFKIKKNQLIQCKARIYSGVKKKLRTIQGSIQLRLTPKGEDGWMLSADLPT